MNDDKSPSNIWDRIGRLKVILDLIATLIVVTPVLLAGWGLIQNGINAVMPAWFVIIAGVFAGLLGYWLGVKTLYTNHKIIYDGRRGMTGFDFEGIVGSISNVPNEKGWGELSFDDGILILQRKNKGGRYELHLNNYVYRGKRSEVIPQNPRISGNRELHLSFDIKVSNGAHTVDFIIKSKATNKWLANRAVRIDKNVWSHFDFSLKPLSSENCWLRIDDRDVDEIGSILYLQNLLLVEV